MDNIIDRRPTLFNLGRQARRLPHKPAMKGHAILVVHAPRVYVRAGRPHIWAGRKLSRCPTIRVTLRSGVRGPTGRET